MSRNLFGAELFFDPKRPPYQRRQPERPRSHSHRVWTAPESEKVEPFTLHSPLREERPPPRVVS